MEGPLKRDEQQQELIRKSIANRKKSSINASMSLKRSNRVDLVKELHKEYPNLTAVQISEAVEASGENHLECMKRLDALKRLHNLASTYPNLSTEQIENVLKEEKVDEDASRMEEVKKKLAELNRKVVLEDSFEKTGPRSPISPDSSVLNSLDNIMEREMAMGTIRGERLEDMRKRKDSDLRVSMVVSDALKELDEVLQETQETNISSVIVDIEAVDDDESSHVSLYLGSASQDQEDKEENGDGSVEKIDDNFADMERELEEISIMNQIMQEEVQEVSPPPSLGSKVLKPFGEKPVKTEAERQNALFIASQKRREEEEEEKKRLEDKKMAEEERAREQQQQKELELEQERLREEKVKQMEKERQERAKAEFVARQRALEQERLEEKRRREQEEKQKIEEEKRFLQQQEREAERQRVEEEQKRKKEAEEREREKLKKEMAEKARKDYLRMEAERQEAARIANAIPPNKLVLPETRKPSRAYVISPRTQTENDKESLVVEPLKSARGSPQYGMPDRTHSALKLTPPKYGAAPKSQDKASILQDLLAKRILTPAEYNARMRPIDPSLLVDEEADAPPPVPEFVIDPVNVGPARSVNPLSPRGPLGRSDGAALSKRMPKKAPKKASGPMPPIKMPPLKNTPQAKMVQFQAVSPRSIQSFCFSCGEKIPKVQVKLVFCPFCGIKLLD